MSSPVSSTLPVKSSSYFQAAAAFYRQHARVSRALGTSRKSHTQQWAWTWKSQGVKSLKIRAEVCRAN